MAKVITDNQHYADIAVAIRTKNKTETLYKPSEMAPAILAIQGGTELNFDVVGGTAHPTNPSENTIWVSTNEEIPKWAFSEEQPTSPTPGEVWFPIGDTYAVKFDALQENSIPLKPISAKQYVNNAWKNVPAMSCHGGEWIPWIRHLYEAGDEFEAITGGWSGYVGYGTSYNMGIYTESSNGMTLQLNGKQTCVSAAPENTVDLTNISKIIVKATAVPSTASCGLYVTPTRAADSNGVAVAQLTGLKVGENTLTLPSTITGKFYIMLCIVRFDSSTEKLVISEVRCE